VFCALLGVTNAAGFSTGLDRCDITSHVTAAPARAESSIGQK